MTQEGPFYQHAMKMEIAKSVVTMLSVINVMIVRRICLDFLTVESVSKHLLQIVIIQKSTTLMYLLHMFQSIMKKEKSFFSNLSTVNTSLVVGGIS